MTTWKEAYDPSWKKGNSFKSSLKDLHSLEGAPEHVKGNFTCALNGLTSLEGAPSYIDGYFDCAINKLTSLKNIHLQIKRIGLRAYFHSNPIKSHVLGLLLIDGLKQGVSMDNKEVENIIDKYLPSKGMESVLLAQEELILAGLEEYAQL